MGRIDRYILSHMAGPFFGALFGVLALLMLERLLRLLDLVNSNEGALRYIFDMLTNLAPHYLGLALPAALFIACYVGYRRLASTSEVAALHSIGRGLGRMALPAFMAAALLAAFSALLHGYLQPHGRYAYRSLGFLAAHASIAAALESGAFLENDGVTFMAEQATPGGGNLAKVFVYEEQEDGGVRIVTSKGGALIESADGQRSALHFQDGLMVEEDQKGGRRRITFNTFDWPINRGALGAFRPRGANEREMTWPELYAARDNPPEKTSRARIVSEMHARAARAFAVLLMPMLAIPLAVAGLRTRTSGPLAFGIITMLVFTQALQFGEGMADLERAPVLVAIWTPVLGLLLISGYLFWRTWRGVGFDMSGWMPQIRLPRRSKAPSPEAGAP
jgi:lipopolysaccharide export system permease protein